MNADFAKSVQAGNMGIFGNFNAFTSQRTQRAVVPAKRTSYVLRLSDPYGNVLNQEEAKPQPFKYVGQLGVMAEANGFYYMRARYYDPQVGRFISEDPIGFEGGDTNLMAYVGNNPVMGVDPSGLWDEETHGQYAGLDKGWTHPWNPFSTYLHFFRDRQVIEQIIGSAINAGNRKAFEAAMHMGQDSSNPAHQSVLKHVALSVISVFNGADPDRPKTYPAEWKAMSNWTKAQEVKWDQANSGRNIGRNLGSSGGK